MTIITQPLSEKKTSQQKVPLVDDIENGAKAEKENGETSSKNPLIVTMLMRSRARRISSLTTICVFLTALLVFTTGIIGGYYLYRQFTQYKLRHFRGWCSVPYSEHQRLQQQPQEQSDFLYGNQQPRISMETFDKAVDNLFRSFSSSDLSKTGNDKTTSKGDVRPTVDDFFDEEFDIDIESELYERIEVPKFARGQRGRFVHDFSVNKTGIIDLDVGRCFIMPLNRTLVMPPRSLFDLVMKMRKGYYNIDTEIVRESYRVITPPISDFRTVGYYIGRECGSLPTYNLEKVNTGAYKDYKRSVDETESKPIFSEFAGHKISEIHIVNVHNAPGSKK